MGKRKKPDLKSHVSELIDRYKRWVYIYENGCSDPCWEDGVNINLVRNHIIYRKFLIEELLGDNVLLYPDEYFFPLPPELPSTFMAVDRVCGCGEMKQKNKILPLEEVFKFDWSEVL